MTEREKMALGLWYDANFDPELCAQRRRPPPSALAFNNADPRDTEEKARLQKLLLPNASEEAYVTAPFQTDYGFNCCIGAGTDIKPGRLSDGRRQNHHRRALLHRAQLWDVHRQPPPLLRGAEPRL